MTPAELRTALAALGLTQTGAAQMLGYAPRTMREWCAGNREIPETVRRILAVSLADRTVLDRIAAA